MKEVRIANPWRDLQPSQVWVDKGRLERVERLMRDGGAEPIPVRHLDGRFVLTDGHSRALAAFLADQPCPTLVAEDDDLDWEAYRRCVAWCRSAGIVSIPDLAGRVVSSEEFEQLWLSRCRRMHRELEALRTSRR